jgi:hypothetical protein
LTLVTTLPVGGPGVSKGAFTATALSTSAAAPESEAVEPDRTIERACSRSISTVSQYDPDALHDFCLGKNSPVTPFDGDNEAGVQAFNSANTQPLPAP